jgi:hypothetical protein
MNESLMQFLSSMGQSGQSLGDVANGKAATMDKRQWQPDAPQDNLNQVQSAIPSSLAGQMSAGMDSGMGGGGSREVLPSAEGQPMPSSLMSQMSGGLPPVDNSGQPTPSSLMGQMSQGISPQMQTPVAPPESQPVADFAPAQYGDLVQEQAQKDKPMDMQSMMGLLQGGMGAYKDVSGEKSKPGFLGGLFKQYLSGAMGAGGG